MYKCYKLVQPCELTHACWHMCVVQCTDIGQEADPASTVEHQCGQSGVEEFLNQPGGRAGCGGQGEESPDPIIYTHLGAH